MFIEIVVSVIGLAFGVFLLVGARQFPPATQPGMPGAAFFPYIVSVVILILSIATLVIALAKRKRMQSNSGNTEPDAKQAQFARNQAFRIAGVVLLSLFYALLWHLNIGNFLINSLVFFIPIAILYDGAKERPWWKTAIFVSVLVVFIYILFKYVLRVAIN